jgi:hypothetical protein
VGLVTEQLEAGLQCAQVGAEGGSPELKTVQFSDEWFIKANT